jgi:hypothetical protein
VLDESLVLVLQIAFTIPVSLVMHDFWNEKDEEKRQVELIQFAKVRHDDLTQTVLHLRVCSIAICVVKNHAHTVYRLGDDSP